MAGPRDQAQPEPAGPVRIPIRLVQRAHWITRQPRRGRTLRTAGHLPELFLRNPAAAVRRGRLWISGGRPDRCRRHQRQDLSPVGRRRAVRRPVWRIDLPRTDPRPARRDADPPRALALTGGQASQSDVHPAGVAGPPQRRGDRVRRRGNRGIRSRDRAVRTRHQRGRTGDLGRPAGVGHPGQAATGRRARTHRAGCTSHAPHPSQRADDGRRDGTRGRGSRAGRDHHRRPPGPGPSHRDLRAAPGTEAAHRQIPGLWLVQPALPPGAARPGRRRAARCPLQRLAGAAGRATRLPRRLLGQRGRGGRGRPGMSASGAFRVISPVAGQRARRTPRDPQQGAHRNRV